jgi:hypothetical protein
MGLQAGGSEGSEMKSTFLAVAGGYIWDKKADKSHPNFATQEFKKLGDEIGTRQGAQYKSLSGSVVGVRFNTHEKYGESILVTIQSNDERFIISISTNNRYSQDMMKGLLKMDFSKEVLLTPYDFIDKKTLKRVQGLSFKQDGQKIMLKNDDAPFVEGDFFKTATPKKIKRFFEDLTEWFVSEVTSKVIDVRFSNGDIGDDTMVDKLPAPTPTAIPQREVKVEAKVEVEEEAKVDDNDLDNQLDALLG